MGWEDGVMSDAAPDPSAPEPAQPGIGDLTAGALVFGSSAAVLVVEIVALRLLAPYLGLTLETSTTVIGLALAAIAAGSWAGGRAADRIVFMEDGCILEDAATEEFFGGRANERAQKFLSQILH